MIEHNLNEATEWAESYLRQLNARAQRKLLKQVVTLLRRRNQERMKQQRNPNGSAWDKRKSGDKTKMFRKLRQARHLKIRQQANAANVGYQGKTGRIARVHHFGLRDQLENGAQVQYAERELLGMTAGDLREVYQILVNHLGAVR